jgi:hypothetical protein
MKNMCDASQRYVFYFCRSVGCDNLCAAPDLQKKKNTSFLALLRLKKIFFLMFMQLVMESEARDTNGVT